MITKIGIAFILGIEVLVCTLLPYYYSAFSNSKKIFKIFDNFSAGLFMGIAFLHILPEANEKIQHWMNGGHEHHHHDHHDHSQHGHHHQIPYGSLISLLSFIFILTIEVYFHDGHCGGDHSHNNRPSRRMEEILSSEKEKMRRRLMFETLLTQMALSVHCFFECMSIGIEKNESVAVTFGFAIIFHKWAQGFTLGFSYANSGMQKSQALRYAIFHSILNFSAVLVGIKLSQSNELVQGIANGISAGTFLYVCLVEKINKNFRSKKQVGKQSLMLLMGLGFSIIILH